VRSARRRKLRRSGVCGGKDSDCAGVTLPPGAVTNKCVIPVETYTGGQHQRPARAGHARKSTRPATSSASRASSTPTD
jgi:hypothetical protein